MRKPPPTGSQNRPEVRDDTGTLLHSDDVFVEQLAYELVPLPPWSLEAVRHIQKRHSKVVGGVEWRTLRLKPKLCEDFRPIHQRAKSRLSQACDTGANQPTVGERQASRSSALAR